MLCEETQCAARLHAYGSDTQKEDSGEKKPEAVSLGFFAVRFVQERVVCVTNLLILCVESVTAIQTAAVRALSKRS